MKKEKFAIQQGCKAAPETFYIKITEDGPYMIYGKPPIRQKIILPNSEGSSWTYCDGMTFNHNQDVLSLCRCGIAHRKPFCDGSHYDADWDPRETASREPLLDGTDIIEGPTLILADNEKYCAFARFCDAYGRIWNIVQHARTEAEKNLAKHEAEHCPAGRLVVWDKETQNYYEPDFEPSIDILEDPGIKVSGPIWVKGGIRIESADGNYYEIRNRVTLCRCGQSGNKPFCDGRHVSIRFHDGLPLEKGE